MDPSSKHPLYLDEFIGGEKSYQSYEVARQILEAQNLPYKCGKVTLGDGNCFFHAIVDQLRDDEIRWTISEKSSKIFDDPKFRDNQIKTIRQALVEYCRSDQQLNDSEWGTLWKADYVKEQLKRFRGRSPKGVWDVILNEMEQNKTYVTAIFVRAAALFFEKDILIIEENSNYRILGSHDGLSKNPPMAMVHMGRIHFQSVLRNISSCQSYTTGQSNPLVHTSDEITYDRLPRKVKQERIREFIRQKEDSRFVKVPMDGSDGICHHCDTAFATISLAKKHAQEVHGPKQFQCPACNEEFTRKDNLDRHLSSVHDNTRPICLICGKHFSRKDKLVCHMSNVHEAKKQYKCPSCPLTFGRKDTLDKHVARATADPTKHGVDEHCSKCGKDFIFPTQIAYRNQRFKKGTIHDNCPNERKKSDPK